MGFIKGDVKLVITFWVYFVLIGNILGQIIVTIVPISGIIFIPYWIISAIAVFNSATKYEGIKIWAFLAQIAAIFSILSMIFWFAFGILVGYDNI